MEVAILIGLQASGKTTFYRQRLAGTHLHVSKDAMRNARNRQGRQMRLIDGALADRRSVAVDNTNPSLDEWRPIIDAARRRDARVIGYWFAPDLGASLRRNATRGANAVPHVGVYATRKRLRRPSLADGFDALYAVRFDGTGGFTIESIGGG